MNTNDGNPSHIIIVDSTFLLQQHKTFWGSDSISANKLFCFTGTASEGTLVALLAARSKTIREHLSSNSHFSIYDLAGRMVAYTSACSHSSVEKAGWSKPEVFVRHWPPGF